MPRLPRSFYVRPTLTVARELLGQVLWHRTPEGIAAGRIVEVEAYLGEDDPASHAFRGPRGRAEVMFREGGVAYVYFSYGVHWCANVVTGPAGTGGAVLMRALAPVRGIALMRRRRGRENLTDLASGPGKLAQALGIGAEQNGADLIASPLGVFEGAAPAEVGVSPRIGITKAADWPLRFFVPGDPHVSRR
jgi:DNA-3-methyladenine glycosylase